MTTINVDNSIKNLLLNLNIIEPTTIEMYYPEVRDNPNIAVFRCKKSGVIFLANSDHIDIKHYEAKENFNSWSAASRKMALAKVYADDYRRANDIRNLVTNKSWLDIGTGAGGILEMLQPFAAEVEAVEPHEIMRKDMVKRNLKIYSNIIEIPADKTYDLISLFHVFEHLRHPIEMLIDLRKSLKKEGKILIEVPHANDFLISFLNLDAFKKFTFWSEHLILHTRKSLELFLQEAGFKNISIKGVQRYPFANHLYWLKNQKPGGHQKWHFLSNPEIDEAYANLLASMNKTDTLLAIAEV